MIASWRGLAIAAAVALGLVGVLIADVAREPAPPGADARALVPGFDPARATELVWEREGRPAIRAVRAGERWELRAPGVAPADPDAISEVLAALRGGRWHRRGDARPVHATLTVIAGAERHALGLGEPIAGTEQRWLVVDGRGVVVDRWVAGALDREPLALRIRRPLADAAGARSIAIAGTTASGAPADLALEGTPRRLVRPSVLWLASEVAGELERALREVAIVRLPDGAAGAHGLAIRLGPAPAGVAIELGGPCPGAPELVALAGTTGDGCVEPAAAEAVERAVEHLRQPPGAIVERRPVPFEPARVVLADGAALELSPPRVGDAAADPARVVELVSALGAPAEVVPLPAARPIGQLVVGDRSGGSIALDLFAAGVVARHGEPVALAVPPGRWQLLVRPSRALRDPVLWLEEPTTITTVTIDGVSYRRGTTIGAWTRQPPGPIDPARLEALVAALAAPRAVGFVDPPLAVVHRVAIDVAPPVGAPVRRELELGAPRGPGCPARVGRDLVVLPAALCAEIAAMTPR